MCLRYKTGQFQMSAYFPHVTLSKPSYHFKQRVWITDFFLRTALRKRVLGGEYTVLTGVRDIPECGDNIKNFNWRRKTSSINRMLCF